MPRFIGFALLLGSFIVPSLTLTCPSLQKCLNLVPSTTSCENVKSWLTVQKSPVDASICSKQMKAMQTKCTNSCPPDSCLTCFEKVNKAVSTCEQFYATLQDTTTNDCEVFKRKLIQRCSQPHICKVCKDSYCQNGGVCHKGSTPHVTSCKCSKGFTGIYCQISLCDDNHKCQNGGKCVGRNLCICPRDFTGPQCERIRLGSAARPAPNAQAILDAGDSKGSGLYWIKPSGDDDPAITYCDMDYQGGGWMLASYGFVYSVLKHPLNRAIPNMNNPMGYTWRPDARSSSNGVVNLTHGAVMMARAATYMMMAAGGNPNTGGIDTYSYVYRIDLRQNKQYKITFANHNRYHGAVGQGGIPKMHMTEFMVEGLKGDLGQYLRFGFGESLGVTWSDSYPTGYGFSPVALEYGTWNEGPFFPSVHSGDGSGNYGAAYKNRIFQPDVDRGSEVYVHHGWYSATSIGKTGQTTIWFK